MGSRGCSNTMMQPERARQAKARAVSVMVNVKAVNAITNVVASAAKVSKDRTAAIVAKVKAKEEAIRAGKFTVQVIESEPKSN